MNLFPIPVTLARGAGTGNSQNRTHSFLGGRQRGPNPTLEDFATLLNVPKMCTWDADQGLFLNNIFAQFVKNLETLIFIRSCPGQPEIDRERFRELWDGLLI